MRSWAWLVAVACAGAPSDGDDSKDADTDVAAGDADADADADADTDTDSDSDADTGPTPCSLQLQLGNGVDDHQPLTPGDPVVMVHGPQGGWHIDLSGLVGGTGSQVGVLPVVIRTSDGLQVSQPTVEAFLALADYDSCTGEFFGQRALIDTSSSVDPPQQFVCDLVGEELQVTVTVRDLATQVQTEDTILVTAAPDPLDPCP